MYLTMYTVYSMTDVGIRKSFKDLPEEQVERIKKYIRFKLYFYAHPQVATMRRELQLLEGIDFSVNFLNRLTKRILRNDLQSYEKFMKSTHAVQEFVARKWAILNFCASVVEDQSLRTSDRLSAASLSLRVVKDLEGSYEHTDKGENDQEFELPEGLTEALGRYAEANTGDSSEKPSGMELTLPPHTP